jgi:septum site-determining protein MinC
MQELWIFCRNLFITDTNGGIQMKSQEVVFKGIKDGILVTVNGCSSFELIKKAIEQKISCSGDFFRNGKVYMDFSNTGMEKNHQDEIRQFLFESYGVSVHSVDKSNMRMFKGIYEGRTRFVKNTVRSGQDIEYAGNIVVIGDVNAGGQVRAGGNIIVLGSLRGVVHAGSSGNKEAVIAAFCLQPTQLRIADVISRPPDDDHEKPRCPELARIKDEYIVIEPCIPNKYL